MAIVKMSKFTILALESQKEALLKELQLFGETELINMQEGINTEAYKELEDLDKDSWSKDYGNLQENLAKVKYSLDFIIAKSLKFTFLNFLNSENLGSHLSSVISTIMRFFI